ncbi:MAG: tetratricopeptide repeat protein, partial [Coleofasciculaceae cyanobacterium SM2_3_26]|nr:tetratricopeptide repeat protein [Coleofasciculaceae cyanobacterium SM2_3_26]
RKGEASSLNNLGIAYDSLGEYQRAIAFHQQSLEIKRQIGDRNGEADSLFNKGQALAKLDDKWNAEQSLKAARKIFEALKLDFRVKQCDTAIAQVGQIIAPTPIRAPQIGPDPIRTEPEPTVSTIHATTTPTPRLGLGIYPLLPRRANFLPRRLSPVCPPPTLALPPLAAPLTSQAFPFFPSTNR